ncbi:uncharacterized protein DUF4340 [Prosthecobacter fusiformis]|uniref:Uncharacterized protein DUF4340 n=1 Tax=Prosthecobacter fusiformis TaxID=48464 RepID=A0A4R7S4Z4_9BACT|nr:DUF4340 domain-containing protein [Prosthecobacter fusiformis]TDU72939.1 uncharacterized protein DUF4340 [Prosthecobacter fusiformis]
MKKILILLIILGGLIATAVVYQGQQNAMLNGTASQGVKLRERLLPDLNVAAVKKIRIVDAKSEATIAINNDGKGAKVVERSGYPASVSRVKSILSELYEQFIASKQEVRKGAWAEIQVHPPGDGKEGTGTLVELIGDEGKVIRSLVLGKQIEVMGGRSSTQFDGGTQRFVRIPEDGDTIWVISNSFMDLEPNPDGWLDKAFFNVGSIKEASVTHPQPEESWKVSRKVENIPDYELVDAKTGEGLDATKVTINSLLSTPVFNDVFPKEQMAEIFKGASKAKLVTYDGFTYDLQIVKKSKDGSDRYYLTVDVSADIPATRPPVKDEKEADKKAADEEFAAKKKTAEEKLAKEKAFSGWGFEVSEYTINNLLKKRSEIVKVVATATPVPDSAPAASPAPAAEPSAPAPAPAPPAPSTPPELNPKPASVSTPAVQIPAVPAPEIKPEADPEAAPVIPEKN